MASRIASSVGAPLLGLEGQSEQSRESRELKLLKESLGLLKEAKALYKGKKFDEAEEKAYEGLNLKCGDFSEDFQSLIGKIDKKRQDLLFSSEAEKLHNEAKQILARLGTTSDIEKQEEIYNQALEKLDEALLGKMTNDKKSEILLDEAAIYNSKYVFSNKLVYLDHAITSSLGALISNNSNSEITTKIQTQLKQSYLFLFNYKYANEEEKQYGKRLYLTYYALLSLNLDDDKTFSREFRKKYVLLLR